MPWAVSSTSSGTASRFPSIETRAGSFHRSTSSSTNPANERSSAIAPFLKLEQQLADRLEVLRIASSTSWSSSTAPRRIGSIRWPQHLQLQHRARHRLGQAVVDVHRPLRPLLEHP